MMVTLRLYRQHDLDLITLYRHPSFSLANAMKKALFAYVRKEPLIIKQPTPYEVSNDKISKTIQMHISLDAEMDKDIIQWLKQTKEGYRNSVLKNIIRGYLSAPCIYTYQDSTSALKSADENNDLFNANIRNLTEIKGKGVASRKRSNKKDNRRVEDSELAKEILNRKTVKSEKTDVIFAERIGDDDKTTIESDIENEILKTKPIKQETPIVKVASNVNNLNKLNDAEDDTTDEDMFNMFSDMMSSM